MSDVPPEGYPPPPPPGSFPPPPPTSYPPPGGYAPPPAGGYQQQGYGWAPGTGPVTAYAGFWIRFAAVLLDGLILAIPTGILTFLVNPDQFNFTVSTGYNPRAEGFANLISTLIGVAYYAYFEGGPQGQTLGKRICSIRVVDADTFQPGIGYPRGIGRYFARILSSIPCALGYFWMLWDPKKQTWHDKLARTCVVTA